MKLRYAAYGEMVDRDPVGKLSPPSNYTGRDKHKNWLREMLAGWMVAPCADCGTCPVPGRMDLIHARGKRGPKTPGRMVTKGMRLEKIKEEFAKYDVVCKNCKGEREAQQGTLGRIVRGDARNGNGHRSRVPRTHRDAMGHDDMTT